MPSRHRAAESSRVTLRPANLTWPAPGDRSPEIRPNRLVLPAPFGPTIPTVSPAPTENDRSSAMTTRPNRFVTWSSSSNGHRSAHLKVGSRSPVILACGSKVLSTTLASTGYLVPFCHWIPTGGVITTPGAGFLEEVKSIGPATASEITTLWMAAATSCLLCGSFTEVNDPHNKQ